MPCLLTADTFSHHLVPSRATSVGNCSLHPTVTAVCVISPPLISSHLISCLLFLAYLSSWQLKSSYLSSLDVISFSSTSTCSLVVFDGCSSHVKTSDLSPVLQLCQPVFTQRSFYTELEKLIHRKFLHRANFYTEKPLHREAFTHRSLYTPPPFTHRNFYKQQTFTQRSMYTEKLLNTEACTRSHL